MAGIVENLVYWQKEIIDAKHGLAPNGEILLGLQVNDEGLRDDLQALFLRQQALPPISRSTLYMCGKKQNILALFYVHDKAHPWKSYKNTQIFLLFQDPKNSLQDLPQGSAEPRGQHRLKS